MRHKIVKALGILSIILLCCTLICGIWISSHPVEDITFHAGLSAAAVVVALISQIASLCKCRFCKKQVR